MRNSLDYSYSGQTDNVPLVNADKAKVSGVSFRAMLMILLAICLTITYIEYSFAFFCFSAFWISLGVMIIFFSFDKKHQLQSFRLFFLFFTVYLIYMVVTNYVYVKDPHVDIFYNPDSVKFFSRIDYLSKIGSSKNMYHWMEGFYVGDWKGFGAIIWVIAMITTNLFDEPNSLLIQKLQIVFLSTMVIVLVYNLSLKYLTRKQAWNATIAFGLLSHVMVFSGVFMRDIYMVFIYTMGFYILFNKWKPVNLLVLILLGVFAWHIRSHNGLFFLCFIALYIYLHIRNKQPKIAKFLFVTTLILTVALVVTFNFTAVTGDTSDELSTYQNYHEGKLEEATGLTAVILRAPVFARPILMITLSQIYPFPVYRGMYVNYIDTYQYLLFPLCIAEIFWIYVWVFVLYGFYKKSYRTIIPQHLKYCLAIALLYIVAAGATSYEFRRLMAVYPVIFLTAAVFYYNLPEGKVKFLKKRTTWGYIGVFAAYLLLTVMR
ncbi:hypothetical protein H8S90_08520 [Olivibacter sp. SDN3]|uniref:hypothetical protein n=1 Tax=Olivibacter sp. SDN3 TaxID=2764720 RepID=UPI0016519B2A|nr:hypothetical protein [Olivibacter sp. SDN3]QNL51600.1 hypothetical protein H8S90_08520 [Olivibacter sp. SDN3]